MASVELKGKRAHFQVQTSPNARKTRFYQFPCVSPWIFGDMDSGIFCVKIFHDSKKKLPKFFMDVRYDIINGASWSREANKSIFKYKRAPRLEKPKFYRFSYAIFHEFLVTEF
ncbi:hypothetical protein H5410_059172 [Solanum commersonii]|uniref:Uncharacterized protein n=1 Tax=Solanum commersonii TaxID=4109 RepID=A0A9J5W2M8_SOLCO|nr:hypothetical protein H5410_059172 [Solanum commersonii]